MDAGTAEVSHHVSANGTAKASDSDYVAKTGTLTFAPGETTKTITIVANGGTKKEAHGVFGAGPDEAKTLSGSLCECV